ncbi:MAG: nitroreductase family protein [Elusimicrobiota bacterium]|jgi:nitroreductase|nr:nitroreductase family protein [Elusimicrobiota bacterium]
MSFLELAKKRYSVREFSDKLIDRNDIQKMILAADLAPSAQKINPWKFIAIDDKNLKLELCKRAFKTPFVNSFVKNAPTIIVACSKINILTHRIFGKIQGLEYHLLDMGASIQNIILEASDLGIGSCWIGWFNEKEIKKLLQIPKNYKVVSLVALGYEKNEENKKIKNLDKKISEIKTKKIILFNKFE